MSNEIEGIEEDTGSEYGEMTGTMRAILAAVQRLAEENARLARRVAEVGAGRSTREQAARPELLEPEDIPDALYARQALEAVSAGDEESAETPGDEPEDADSGAAPVFPEVQW